MDIYKIVSLEEAFNKINPNAPLAFDTETIGLYGTIRLAQFYQPGWTEALLVERPNAYQLLAKFSQIPDCNIIMQNAAYDISVIQDNTGSRWQPNTFSDTLLLARLAFPHLSEYTLDALFSYVMGYDPYLKAGLDKKKLQKSNWKAITLTKEQLLYASLDVFYLFEVYEKVKVQTSSVSYRLDILALQRALDFQRNGFAVDQEACMAQHSYNTDAIAKLAVPINVNSWQQVRPYIGSNESDDLALARLSFHGNEKAANVRAARKLIKQNSFLDKFMTDDGRIYGHFAPIARSGRFTCKRQNLQQLPRATKHVFGLPEDGDRVLLYSDYSQLELRSITAITMEKVMLDLYAKGKDVHNYVAEMIFGSKFTKTHRQIAKTCNFNLLYGGGAKMLQSILLQDAGLYIELEGTHGIYAIVCKWKRLFRQIRAWQEAGIAAYHRGHLGSTPLGRQYRGRLMTDQLNIENQGFGAEVAKLAMHYVYDDLKQYEAEMVNFIHDSYILEMPNDEGLYKPCAKLLGDAMQEAWHEGTKSVKIKDLPMPVNVAVGFNWGDIENEALPNLYDYTA